MYLQTKLRALILIFISLFRNIKLKEFERVYVKLDFTHSPPQKSSRIEIYSNRNIVPLKATHTGIEKWARVNWLTNAPF